MSDSFVDVVNYLYGYDEIVEFRCVFGFSSLFYGITEYSYCPVAAVYLNVVLLEALSY